MAQNQVDTERRLDRLHEQIKEQEIMLEDEVARLEVYLGEKLDAADLRLDETVAQVRGGKEGSQYFTKCDSNASSA